ncbi:hypothetical protein ACTJJ7_12320 [Phyllobacterium sp. 22229]|uniref:Uncharacterized protein n=1 Tax=Agrobacterium radiobacter TaxID=362 RepID=A0ABD5LR90_AGRRD
MMEADEREIFSSLTGEVSFISEEAADFQRSDVGAKVFRLVLWDAEGSEAGGIDVMGDRIATSIRWV